MAASQCKHNDIIQHIERLACDRCRKRWEAGWVETLEGKSVEHALTCDCGRVMKVVQVAEGNSPLMVMQHPHWKTIAACLPAFAAGAFFPVTSEPLILSAYLISWIACAATFVNDHNRSASALAGIAIWGIAIVSGAAAAGALAAHALWWWW